MTSEELTFVINKKSLIKNIKKKGIKLFVATSIPTMNGIRNLRSGICFHEFTIG